LESLWLGGNQGKTLITLEKGGEKKKPTQRVEYITIGARWAIRKEKTSPENHHKVWGGSKIGGVQKVKPQWVYLKVPIRKTLKGKGET